MPPRVNASSPWRLSDFLDQVSDDEANLAQRYRDEKVAWDGYYDALQTIARRQDLRKRRRHTAKGILERCLVRSAS